MANKTKVLFEGKSLRIMLGDQEILDLGPAGEAVSKSGKSMTRWTTGGATSVSVPGHGSVRVNLNVYEARPNAPEENK